MENYNLREDEVVLWKGNINLSDQKECSRLILTNLNLVFITKINNSETDEIINTEIYNIQEVKMYQGVPQVKTKASKVEIYLKSTEKEFTFDSKNELHKFVSEINKLLTGKTTAERNAEKIKNAIHLVNDTLGVDIVKGAGEVVKNGIVGSVSGSIGKIGTALITKKKK